MLKILEILDPTFLDQQPLIPPKDAVPEGATVVGRLPDHLQKLKSFVTGLKRQADRLDLDIKHCDDDEQRAGFGKELEEIVGERRTGHQDLLVGGSPSVQSSWSQHNRSRSRLAVMGC